MVEFVFKVIRRPVNLKLRPQMPKPNAKKINVNDIGKPIKITKGMYDRFDEEDKTMTGKPATKISVDPDMEDK